MNISIKVLYEILDFLKIWEILKENNQQKIALKKKYFEFSKYGIYVKEPCQVYMRTKYYVDILKNDPVFVF